MASEYIYVPVETDPDALAQNAFDYLTGVNPGWEPSDGQLDTWIIEAGARMSATMRDLASDVPPAIFRYFGAKVIGLAPIDAASAQVGTNWTLSDTLGHTIPAGTVVGIASGGDYLPFEVLTAVTVAPGASTATGVLVSALEPGIAGTALGTNGTAVILLDQLAWVSTITQAAATSRGVDAETDDAYLSRLSARLQLMAPRPIVPADFAALARDIPGVARAAYKDLWDAPLGTGAHDRTITIAVVDANGAAVSSGVKASVDAYLQAQREVNFLIYVVDPTSNVVDVTYTAVVYPNYTASEVHTRIDAAVTAFLHPSAWGTRNSGDIDEWDNKTTVKLNDLIIAIGKVEGVDDVNAAAMRISPAAYASTDLTLTGVFPLPVAGTITGTVT